ncbi:hypothetical protein [Amycolatopsis taiwanensis]|uniref:HNH endonuclease n=1 Tax=Amycolatopsis taiwanensis TaxID=342230 RepID=A0A9W6VL61_9PSEU|nr:hypothetical protein [Amycolatopsis taiwanensis]GLY70191.1 hypothetical protein Atai01_68100 [Amycolatopsis taiwanensis]
MPAAERDSFANLLLLCLGHHEEVDDDEDRYPPEKLKEWKTAHEGAANSVLNRLTVLDTNGLMELLTQIAEPPLDRLETITKRLEETGSVTADTVNELKQIIAVMSDTGVGIDAHTAQILSYAAEVLGTSDFSNSARLLATAADILPSTAKEMSRVAEAMNQFR